MTVNVRNGRTGTTVQTGLVTVTGTVSQREGEIIPGETTPFAAGAFPMGAPWAEGSNIERPVHTVTLSVYEIRQYEVSNQKFTNVLNWANDRQYRTPASSATVTAYGHELLAINTPDCPIAFAAGQFSVKTRDGHTMADHPVVMVPWYGAAAYCN